MIHRLLLNAFFLAAVMSPHLPLSLSAQGWEAIQAENFDGSGFSAALQGVAGFHAVGFVRSTYGSNGSATDTCALLQPYAAGSLIAMEVALDTTYEYRLRLTVKPFGENQAVQFSYHTAPSSGGTPIGWGVSIPSLSTDDPSLPGVDTASAVFMVNAAGTYWVIAKAFEIGAATGWVRYDDFVLERRLMEECLSVAGPDVEICQGDTVQVGTGCLPSPHPLDSLEYCYRWMPETGLDDPENAMPNASPEQTVTYRVYVTASDGELVAEDEVTVKVNTVEVRILPEDPSLCYRDMPGARPGRNAAPAENRAVGCTQEYVVLSLDGAYATAEWITGMAGGSIEVYEPGLYSVSVTDANGCEGSAEVEVEMCTTPSLEITSCSSQLCEAPLTLSAPGGFVYYSWSDGSVQSDLTVFDTGTYSVTVEDINGCIAIDSFTVEECNPVVDISIYNGFFDWVSGTTGSGGQMIADSLEYSKGAITVANLNDTDGDNIPDFEDMNVTASMVGRNEIDLMRLDIPKPVPFCGGKLKLKVLQGQDKVKFWNQPSKVDSLSSNNNGEYEIDFSGNVQVTLYVEALNYSDTLKDIFIEAFYFNADTVSATAFWAKADTAYLSTPTMAQVSTPIATYTGGSQNNCPTPTSDPQIQLDNYTLFSSINCIWIANNMSRYGFGLCHTGPMAAANPSANCPNPNFAGDNSQNEKRIGGRIFWEFQILPNLHPHQYEYYELRFDVTRQRKTNTQKMDSGSSVFQGQPENFPWEDQLDNEKANDDSGFSAAIGQNDNIPSPFPLCKIYSFDPPASDIYGICNDNLAYKVYRAWLKEFVRMTIGPFQTNTSTGQKFAVEGSRASSKMDWYTIFQIRRGSNGLYKMVLDIDNASVSFPIKSTNSGSNGMINLNVSDTSAVNTNGYRLVYKVNGNSRTWTVINTTTSDMTTITEGPALMWVSDFEGVNISINEGTSPFVDGDTYTYSTFKSQNPLGKVNQMGRGMLPYPINSPF